MVKLPAASICFLNLCGYKVWQQFILFGHCDILCVIFMAWFSVSKYVFVCTPYICSNDKP